MQFCAPGPTQQQSRYHDERRPGDDARIERAHAEERRRHDRGEDQLQVQQE